MLTSILKFFNRFANNQEKMIAENKRLIIGLGNVGPKYHNTRHNAGFMVADKLAEIHNSPFADERYAAVSRFRIKNKQVVVIKPSTYMNLSGKAVSYYMDKEKISLENILVITDDIALETGQLRIRKKGGAGGHNGLQNIIDLIGSNEYARIRIGVGNNFSKGRQADFVLSPWENEEFEAVNKCVIDAANACESFVKSNIDLTMNQFNKKTIK